MKAELEAVKSELVAAQSAMERIADRIERLLELASNAASIPIATKAPVSDHRRLHKPGRPAKIDADPELRLFLQARIDRMTFEEMAADVTAHFPKDRRVAKSAIHSWAGRAGLIPKR